MNLPRKLASILAGPVVAFVAGSLLWSALSRFGWSPIACAFGCFLAGVLVGFAPSAVRRWSRAFRVWRDRRRLRRAWRELNARSLSTLTRRQRDERRALSAEKAGFSVRVWIGREPDKRD